MDKLKFWPNDGAWKSAQQLRDHQSDSSWGDMNVCTHFHGNPSNSCQDLTLKSTNVDLMVALGLKDS